MVINNEVINYINYIHIILISSITRKTVIISHLIGYTSIIIISHPIDLTSRYITIIIFLLSTYKESVRKEYRL